MAEASLLVFQRCQNDILNGMLRFAPDTSRIDFQSYLIEYWLCMDVLPKFIQTFCPPVRPEEAEESPQGAFVFGG